MLSTKELLGLVLLDVHNCHHMLQFFAGIRTAILAGQLAQFSQQVLASMQLGGLPPESRTITPDVLTAFEASTAVAMT